jgi:hypothetical protein
MTKSKTPVTAGAPHPTIRLPGTPEGRIVAYADGRLNRAELTAWAARHPEEVPLINGELPWIAATLA